MKSPRHYYEVIVEGNNDRPLSHPAFSVCSTETIAERLWAQKLLCHELFLSPAQGLLAVSTLILSSNGSTIPK